MAHSSDRDTNHALRARLDDASGQYQRLRAGLTDLQQRLAAMRITAVSDDELIHATVGPRGQLTDLHLDQRVARYPDADTLARAILATVQAAAARTTDEVQQLLSEYVPPGSGAVDFVRDNDFGSLLRRQDAVVRQAGPHND